MQSRLKPDYAFGFRFFFSAPHIAIALMFGIGIILWPSDSFPPSYDLMFSIAPKYVYGFIIAPLSLVALVDYLLGKKQAWKRANIILGVMFCVLVGIFIIPGSITGVTTYGCCAAYSFLHGFGCWVGVGFEAIEPPRTKNKSRSK